MRGKKTRTGYITVENPLQVEPDTVRKSVILQRVIVSIINQFDKPIAGKQINAKSIDEFATVHPVTATTNEKGKAKFKVRFKALSKEGEVEFTSTDQGGNSISNSIFQK